MRKHRFITLDYLRVIAANLVVLGHLRALLFVDYHQLLPENQNISSKLFYLVTSWGHEAVIIFFVLSGFLVGGTTVNQGAHRLRLTEYFIKRISRLSVPLIPALLLTWGIDFCLSYHHPEILQGQYFDLFNSGPNSAYDRSLKTFVGNVFFLQGIYVPTFGTNSPLWSLANEFWYYTIFPLMFLGIIKCRDSLGQALLYLIPAGLLLFILPQGLIFGFWLWLLGTGGHLLLFKLKNPKRLSKFSFLSATILFICALLIGQLKLNSQLSDALTALAATASVVFLGVTKRISPVTKESVHALWSKFFNDHKSILLLSDSSYTLYITHFPIMLGLYTLSGLSPAHQFQDMQQGLPLFLLLYAGVLVCSLVMYNLFEKHHFWVRNRLLQLFRLQRETVQ